MPNDQKQRLRDRLLQRRGGAPPERGQRRPPKKKKKKSKRGHPAYRRCIWPAWCWAPACWPGIGWLLFNDLCSLNKDYVEVKITVDEGDSVGDVAKKLKDAGLINYRGFFKFCGHVFPRQKSTIDPGEWKLNSDMDYRSLIQNMHDYEADKVNKDGWIEVVIPEGKTVNEIIDIMVRGRHLHPRGAGGCLRQLRVPELQLPEGRHAGQGEPHGGLPVPHHPGL